jgi:tRNA threonylcarbamoyladenosine modification (KEOPS) complex Cgi121 subunit
VIDNQKLMRWLSSNKQIGESFSFNKEGEECFSSVAIQRWGDVYKVYVDEIMESQMACENYIRDEVLEFNSAEEAIEFVSIETMATLENLTPSKGQKIFDPQEY